MASVQTIEVKALSSILSSNPKTELIDVRTPAEYESAHAVGAKLIPLDQLDPQKLMAARANSTEPLYVMCKAGGRSAKACEKFITAGFTNVVSVAGGIEAWRSAGLPVTEGTRKVLPLDRQMQLAAGSICLTGVILGTFVNPWFYLLCAMVGAGLTTAGLTGLCPMIIFLSRMPWNKASGCKTNCSC